MASRIAVLGGGFRGLAVAFFLARRGSPVTVIESAPMFGGVLQSPMYQGLALDYGCHLFDNTTDRATEIFFEMVGGSEQFRSVDVRYAAFQDGKLREGIAIPDFQDCGETEQAKYLLDLLHALSSIQGERATDLPTAVIQRFGLALGDQLLPMIEKVYQLPGDDIGAEALELGLFKRVRLLPASTSVFLKRLPELDERLAVASASLPSREHRAAAHITARNFYPSDGGMGGFTDRLLQQLGTLGVELRSATAIKDLQQKSAGFVLNLQSGGAIQCEGVVSAIDDVALEKLVLQTDRLEQLNHSVPMVLYYFLVDPSVLTGICYTHNFDDRSFVFRVSAPGHYGNQLNSDGLTYICCEMPTTTQSDHWQDPEKYIEHSWEAAKQCGIVKSDADFVDCHTKSLKKSYSVPKKGYALMRERVDMEIRDKVDRLVRMPTDSFSKTEILSDAEELVHGI